MLAEGRADYKERKRNEKRLNELKGQLRKFESAFRDEGNNAKMANFCIQGISRIKAEMSYLITRI